MEEAYLYDQGYTPRKRPPYQHLDTTHTNPMDMVMHVMDMKIFHHHTQLLKLASKKLFSCYVKKGKSFGKPKNKSTI
ncbi:hypothetical protein PIB30_093431, partial [Stylosanthes scabra]|nr:hypothetical protein [Stylosanthes scabra]